MVDKKVENWIKLAKRDLDFAKEIQINSNFKSYCPHYCHQSIEKLLKAIIVYETNENPPYVHNLVKLAKVTKIDIDKDKIVFLATLNPHYIGTKYPEDIAQMFKHYTKSKVTEIYQDTSKIFKWLKRNLK